MVGSRTIDVGGGLGPGSAMIESMTPTPVEVAIGSPKLSAPAAAFVAAADVMGDERANEDPSVWADDFAAEPAVTGGLALVAVPAVPVDRPRAMPVLSEPTAAAAAIAAAVISEAAAWT